MDVKFRDYFSVTALKSLWYMPNIIKDIRNWYSFLIKHAGFCKTGGTIFFRNNLKIKAKERIDCSTIAAVFFHKDYGTVKDNSIIIDVGANIGVYSIFAASTSKNAKIYAYEPAPASYDILIENININRLNDNIIPFNMGVWGKKRKIKLFYGKSSPYNSAYVSKKEGKNKDYIVVDCTTIENIFKDNMIPHCDILKVDCEGAEFEIFYNTSDLYFKNIREIRMEYHNLDNQKHNIKSLISFLKTKGFIITKLRKDSSALGNVWLKRVDTNNIRQS